MIEDKEYIAYSGDRFVIEWYYDMKGHSDPFSYFETLTEIEQDRTFYLFKRMGDFGKISDTTKFNNEGDGIFAFKPQPHRFLSFFVIGKKIIITNAYRKKGNKLPTSEKTLAKKRRSDYIERTKKGNYYEK